MFWCSKKTVRTSVLSCGFWREAKRWSLDFVGDNPQRKADKSKHVQLCFCEVRFLILCFVKSFASFLFAHYINKRVLAAGRFSGSLLWCMKPIEQYSPEVRFLVSFKLVTCCQLSFDKREWAHSLLVLPETVCKEPPGQRTAEEVSSTSSSGLEEKSPGNKCARSAQANQRHFGGKLWNLSSFTTCRSGGNKLSKVRSFIILRSGEGSASFNNNKSDNFAGGKSTMKLSGREATFWEYVKKL